MFLFSDIVEVLFFGVVHIKAGVVFERMVLLGGAVFEIVVENNFVDG